MSVVNPSSIAAGASAALSTNCETVAFEGVAQHIQVRDVLPAAGQHGGQAPEGPSRAVGGLLGNESREMILSQGSESSRIEEGGQGAPHCVGV